MKAYIEVNKELCKSCGLCVITCPRQLLRRGRETNSKGYLTVVQTDSEQCIGCKLCAVICPDSAITVYKDLEA